jgi:hypothetical protein
MALKDLIIFTLGWGLIVLIWSILLVLTECLLRLQSEGGMMGWPALVSPQGFLQEPSPSQQHKAKPWGVRAEAQNWPQFTCLLSRTNCLSAGAQCWDRAVWRQCGCHIFSVH